jgi:hypothetical protein
MDKKTNELELVQGVEDSRRNIKYNIRQRFNGRVSEAMPLIKIYISQLRQVYRNSIEQKLPTLKDAVGDVLEEFYQGVGRDGRKDLFESGLIGY